LQQGKRALPDERQQRGQLLPRAPRLATDVLQHPHRRGRRSERRGRTRRNQLQQRIERRAQAADPRPASLPFDLSRRAMQQPGTRGIQRGNGRAVDLDLGCVRPGHPPQQRFKRGDSAHRPGAAATHPDRLRRGIGILPDQKFCAVVSGH